MSRPPRPHFRQSTTGVQEGRRDRLDYLPYEFRDFVELQKELASSEAGLATTGAEGDFANTLMEASAVLAHLLGVYQDVYAREAYLLTAVSPRSLVHHARRLAYQPDRGLSATGYAVLSVGEGLEGTVEKGFALASVPRGEVKAQDYETLDDVDVRADWNRLLPASAEVGYIVRFLHGQAELRVAGTGYGFETGDPVLFLGPANRKIGLTVTSAEDVEAEDVTLLGVGGGPSFLLVPPGRVRLLARPRRQHHAFAWNADSVQFPPSAVKAAGGYTPPTAIGDITHGYQGTPHSKDVYLDTAVSDPLFGSWILHRGVPYRVTGENLEAVTLRRGQVIGVPEPLFNDDGTPQIQNGKIQTADRPQLVETQVSGSVTTLRLENVAGQTPSRSDLPFPSTFLADFELDLELATSFPNVAAVSQPVAFDDDLSDLEPGRHLVLSNLDETTSQVVSVKKIELQGGKNLLSWNPVSGEQTFQLSDFKVLANVVELAHGKSKTEVLGGSDGITPFLRFVLKENPTSQLPGPGGGEPAIEVRVHGVGWERVDDFYGSGPEDRHYRIEIDPEQAMAVVFGDGKNGAIPPLGKKHILAIYKVGLGADGNAAGGQVSRIKKAHPLVERALNPLPVRGGAAPADTDAVRRQATRYVRTFDRAVSVQDHADLALLFPGIARAAATWSDTSGIELVVADAQGEAPADKAAVEAFLAQRRDTDVPLVLVDPVAVDLQLVITVEHDTEYLTENIRIALRNALYGDSEDNPGMFTFAARSFGQAAHLSEVYARLAGLAGVDYVHVSHFARGGSGVQDVLLAAPRQWLRLRPNNLTVQAGKANPP